MDAVLETTLKTRLFSQFRNSVNIQALIEILADPLQDTFDVLDFLLDNSSIDDAEGEQLELLGELIGVIRPKAQETRLFTLCRKSEVQHPDLGFSDDENPGGYLTTLAGLYSATNPGTTISNAEYRKLIRQKAESYRSKMTREILFGYLIASGARCKIDDDTTFYVEIDMLRYSDLNNWTREYIKTRGFKPGGILVDFVDTTRHGDSI